MARISTYWPILNLSRASFDRSVSGLGKQDAIRRPVVLNGSLLQIADDVVGGQIVGHRLAYVPCPYDLDLELLDEGHGLADVCDLYRGGDAVLRSPIRFDYDPASASLHHPAAHMTLNTTDCRIACVAPLRALRFLDFVFRSFYVKLWKAHATFFEAAAWRHAAATTTAFAPNGVHLAWDTKARRPGAQVT